MPELDFQRTPVTLALMGIAAALELTFTIQPDARVDFYNNWLGILPYVWAGQPWRPLTSALMHGNLIHAAFNIYWLAVFGQALETRFGPWRTLAIVVLLAYASMMPEYVIGSYHRRRPVMIVGLSGVVYGLFGVVLIGRRWHNELRAVCDDPTVQILIGWFFLCIVLTQVGLMRVANIAHAAGFVFGMLYGLAIFDARRRAVWLAVAIPLSALVLATLVACPGHYGYEQMRLLR